MTTELAPEFTPTQSRALATSKGKFRGTRYLFTGVQTASEVRAALKAKGVKGAALSKQVNDVLRGAATLSQQLAHAFIVEETRNGVTWDFGDSLKGSAVLRGTRVKEDKSDAPAPSLDEAIESMTEEQATALIAKLAAKFGS